MVFILGGPPPQQQGQYQSSPQQYQQNYPQVQQQFAPAPVAAVPVPPAAVVAPAQPQVIIIEEVQYFLA